MDTDADLRQQGKGKGKGTIGDRNREGIPQELLREEEEYAPCVMWNRSLPGRFRKGSVKPQEAVKREREGEAEKREACRINRRDLQRGRGERGIAQGLCKGSQTARVEEPGFPPANAENRDWTPGKRDWPRNATLAECLSTSINPIGATPCKRGIA